MDIDRLRYLHTIAETSSLRKAAELLRVSPAALSKSMRVLADELQTELFVPSGRGIILTERARDFVRRSRSLLDEYDRLIASPISDVTSEKILRIATFEVFSTYFMGPLMRSHFPEHALYLHECVPGHIEEAIAKEQCDFGISYIPLPHPQLEHVKIVDIEMGLFRKDRSFPHTPFEQLPFAVPITPITGAPTKVLGLDGWPDDRIPRRMRFKCAMMETALELCRQGEAVAYLPKLVVRLHNQKVKAANQLVEFPPPTSRLDTKQSVYLIVRKGLAESKDMRELAKALRIHCREP